MSTSAQVAANRANSQLSTGPRTPEGKARASQNARKEGFTARTLRIRPDQQAEFDAFRRELIHDTQADGAVENEFFDRLLLYGWNLRRVRADEAGLLAESDYVRDELAAERLHRLARYRRDLERSYDRALAELRRLQTQRAVLLQQHKVVVEDFLACTPLAELAALTKHTDTTIDRLSHPLIHVGCRLSEIRRSNPRQSIPRDTGEEGEIKADPPELLDPEVAAAMHNPRLPDADKLALARLMEEVA